MLKIPFLRRKERQNTINANWGSRSAPRFIRSFGVSPVALVFLSVLFGLFLFFIGTFLAVAPVFVVIVFVFIILMVGLWLLVLRLAPGAPLWIKGVFFVVVAQVVLNIGFSGMYVGAGNAVLPLSDLMLAIALFASFLHVAIFPKRVRLPLGVWILTAWVALNLAIHLPNDYRDYGMAAARDGIRIAESLYIIPAYVAITLAFSAGKAGANWLKSTLYGTAVAIGLYGLLCPFQSTVLSMSPGFSGWQKWIPVFGNFQTWPMAGLMSIFGVLLWRWAYPGKLSILQRVTVFMIFISGLVAFAVLQSRAGYVFFGLSALVFMLIGGQGRQFRLLIFSVVLCGVGLLAIEVSGVNLQGRVGKLSLSGVADHVLTLTGQSKNPEFNGAAGGISQRKEWRAYSLALWRHSMETQVVGIGFGRVLTNLTTLGENGEVVMVQDPHNSFVTTLTRSGLLGLTVMLSVYAWVFYMAIAGYRRLRHKNKPVAAFFLGLLLFQIYCMVNAWGEPHFEVSHYIIPTFFIYGVAWAVWDKYMSVGKAMDFAYPVDGLSKIKVGLESSR